MGSMVFHIPSMMPPRKMCIRDRWSAGYESDVVLPFFNGKVTDIIRFHRLYLIDFISQSLAKHKMCIRDRPCLL